MQKKDRDCGDNAQRDEDEERDSHAKRNTAGKRVTTGRDSHESGEPFVEFHGFQSLGRCLTEGIEVRPELYCHSLPRIFTKRLSGKTALITRGNSGIGLATARLFVAEGARVGITGRNQKNLDAAAAELGDGQLAIKADATDVTSTERAVAAIAETFGKLDLVFACGIFPAGLGAGLNNTKKDVGRNQFSIGSRREEYDADDRNSDASIRVSKAKHLLETGDVTISETACEVGFVDQSHLTRHFKRMFGLPPKALLRCRE